MYVDAPETAFLPDLTPTLESLIAWLERQPAKRAYDYSCAAECIVAEWLKSIDPKSRANWPLQFHYTVNGGTWHMDDTFRVIGAGTLDPGSWTYGAALERARRARR